jgi:type II restriction/modification system DNA methylase subunit YeeA
VTPEQFIAKWKPVTLTERSASQQHFIDLCHLLGEPTPAEADPTGNTYTFEKGATKATGGNGWADVWRRGIFGWEYKGKGKDLDAAYLQLKLYSDALENPPLLVTSDIQRIVVHTNFTNSVKKVHTIQLEDLADPKKIEMLRWVFAEPEKLRPGLTRAMVTTAAAEQFSAVAHLLQSKGHEPQKVAHFLNRLIFCMFAEDVGLLPNNVFNRMVSASAEHPESFQTYARQLFASMAKGGTVAFEKIDWFNGGLFDDDTTLPLGKPEIDLLLKCADLDWTSIEPSIFGTLFERGLDPDKRSQQGTHYTDPATIMKIVCPVVLEPWERRWAAERKQLERLLANAKSKVSDAAVKRFTSFLEDLYQYRVLDPACGSGNFLYVALRSLKGFEKRVILEAEALGLPRQFPRVGPEAVMGIEVNPYAAELARVTVWIGEIQWMLEQGFGVAMDPILRSLDQIECRDALLTDSGTEAVWPKTDAIIGNPPFLGDKKLVRGLGQDYVDRLRTVYADRVPGGADLCCYWFEKMRGEIAEGRVARGGLVATDNIRSSPKNRAVLVSMARDAKIFGAWTDQPWVNEGAAVRVSLICCAKHPEPAHLNGTPVEGIEPDLTAGAGSGGAATIVELPENEGIAFSGITKKGAFDIPGEFAREMLLAVAGPHGRKNAEVLFPWKNGEALTKGDPDRWIISFGEMSEDEAALFEQPFDYVRTHVLPARSKSSSEMEKRRWWLLARRAPDMFAAISGLSRFLVTPETSKHRVFAWLSGRVVPDKNLVVVAREDDTTFGVLQSRIHTLWALRVGTRLENRPRYTSSTTFRTFPFPADLSPNQPAQAFKVNPHAQAIAAAARQLDELRQGWLVPAELVDRVPEVVEGYPDRIVPKNAAAAAEIKKRTFTALYNANPPWLQHANRDLDQAVAAAYGWPWPLEDEEVLKRLFALNAERASYTLQERALHA